MSLESSLPAMMGGLITAGITKYLGFNDPFVAVLGASVGGGMVNKIFQTYSKHKDSNPVVLASSKLISKLQNKIGLNYSSVMITESQKSIYNRLEAYILNKYKDSLTLGSIRKTDNVNVELSLNNAEFKTPVIDHFENHRIYLIVYITSIELRSYTADMNVIKAYIQQVMNTRLGQRQINIQQCVIEKGRYGKDDQQETSIHWNSFTVETNKTLVNTIVRENVKTELFQDLEHFVQNEEYYNKKGIPYKRGYMLYGPPGTGKTSIIKSIASHYGMSVYIVNMCDVERESDVINIFKNIKGVHGYYILCFEDFDRSPFLQWDRRNADQAIYRAFINELDGIIECTKRITFITANDESVITCHQALCRPGRIDKSVKIDFCDADQLNRLYAHYSDTNLPLNLTVLTDTISAAQVVKHILDNPNITPEEFKGKLKTIEAETKEEVVNQNERGRSRVAKKGGNWNSPRRVITRQKRHIEHLNRKIAKKIPNEIKRAQIKLAKLEKAYTRKKERERKAKEKEKKRKGVKGKK